MNHTSDYSEGLSYLGVRESDQLLPLKEKIGEMTNELEGVISDRNRLQDLSNKLQVELNKSKRDHFRSHNSIETNFPKDQSGNMKFTTVGDVVIRGKPHLVRGIFGSYSCQMYSTLCHLHKFFNNFVP